MARTVTLDRDGLAIDGQPLYLLAGQIHYFRYPRAEWREVLLEAKAGGINTVDTVIPWNLHEPHEGQFDFAEEADLAGFLDLCAELGLWAIVRPGPYICAEWENGGFPAWLTMREGIELRVDNPIFLEPTLGWFDTLFGILTPRQATHGGPIILCQIENEHWASGRYGHDMHQQTLADAAIARGMHVPQYTCMGATAGYAEFRNGWSGIAEKLQQTRALWPENPMIVSELWSGWFDNWGASRHSHKTATRLDTILHQLTAVGASGFSHWMWAGGTNFAFWGGRTVGGDTVHMTTSYDYDAPISEYGGLTPKFYAARRHHLFLETLGMPLACVLADAVAGGPKVISPAAVAGRGEAGAAPYRNVRAGATAPLAWRDFTATFLQNALPEGMTYQVFLQPAVHLVVEVEPNAIKPIFANMPLGTAGIVLAYHTARILGFWPHEQGDMLVLYGNAGEVGKFEIQNSKFKVLAVPAHAELDLRESALTVDYWITDRPTILSVMVGDRRLQVVLLTTERAERFWPLPDGTFACGPDLVVTTDDTQIEIERRGVRPFYQIMADGALSLLDVAPPAPLASVAWAAQALAWQQHAVAELADGDYAPLARPIALEQLGAVYGYGWYRAKLHADAETTLQLAAPWLGDRARVILDGVDCGWLGVHPRGPQLVCTLAVAAGSHDLRLLVDNLGRFNYGANTGEQKGLTDTLYLSGVQQDITDGWVALWQEASFAGDAIANAKPWAVRPDAINVSLARFAFQGPTVWLLRAFEAEAGRQYLMHLTGDRNSGALFINGANVARFSRHNGGGFIKADITAHVHPGTNVIALNIQNYAGIAWHAHLLAYDPQRPLAAEWSFRAGVTPAASSNSHAARPYFYRARFAYDPAHHGAGPFKFYLIGLRKGQIWLNGRGVGRYWQLGPQEAYKLPASWLQAENELLIFEEETGVPNGAWIGADAMGASQRVIVKLV